MRILRHHWLMLIMLISLLGSSIPVHAAAPSAQLQDYLLPDERMLTLQPPLRYGGRTYRIHYFTPGPTEITNSSFIGLALPERLTGLEITGFLVTADGDVVKDEETLAEVIALYRSAYYLYEVMSSRPFGFLDAYPFDDLRDDLHKITHNPIFIEQFVQGLLEKRQDKFEAALRAMLMAQQPLPWTMESLKKGVLQALEDGQPLADAVSSTVEGAATLKHSPIIRNTAENIKNSLRPWRPVSEQANSDIILAGTRFDFFNALDVVSLAINLAWVTEMSRDRVQMLEDYVGFATGDAAMDEAQLRAAAVVMAELENEWLRRGDIMVEFVKDKSYDFMRRVEVKVLAESLAQWGVNRYGTKSAAHLLGAAASKATVILTVANYLYGLDDLYSNFRIAEACDELRRSFYAARLRAQEEARQAENDIYDGELASEFRVAYMLEALAGAQALRSYGDGVEATVRKGLIGLIQPINWFKGKEWREAAAEIKEAATSLETDVEDAIGHPEVVDEIVALAMERLQVPYGIVPVLHDALVLYSPGSVPLKPAEATEIYFDVQNTGKLMWRPGGDYTLVNTNGASLGVPTQVLQNEVPAGKSACWSMRVTAPQAMGVSRTEWQMAYRGEPFGAKMSALIFVTPEGELPLDPVRILEEWWQQGRASIRERIEQWLAEITRKTAGELEHQFERLWREFWDALCKQLCGVNLLLGAAVLIGVWGDRAEKRRKEWEDHDGHADS